MSKFLKIFFLLIFVLLIGCGEKKPSPDSEPNTDLDKGEEEVFDKVNVEDFKIIGPDTLDEGDEYQYTCEYHESYYIENWEIDNADIAEIDENGRLTAYEAGNIKITVTLCGVSTKDIVKITKDVVINKTYSKAVSLKVETENAAKVGASFEIKVIVYPEGANQSYTVSSSNEEVGYIDNSVFYAVKGGKTTITVTHIDGKLTQVFDVNVYEYEVNNNIDLFDGVSRDMTSYEFWLNLYEEKDEVILSPEEIAEYNKRALAVSNTYLYDLSTIKSPISKADLVKLINRYSFSSSYKINGAYPSSNYQKELLANRNIDGIKDYNELTYGLIINFTAMRSFPTADIATTTNDFDRFQETGLEVGEGVVIYHESLDGEWVFVHSFNYYGWVNKKDITLVTRDEMLNFINPSKFIFVLARHMQIDGVDVRMSTKLPVVTEDENSYTVLFPKKDGIGMAKISKQEDVHYGYLPYTNRNVFVQIFKLLGDMYRWGDQAYDGHDCASTMNAVYRCMGFMTPRNTSNQDDLPFNSYNVENKSDAEKKKILDDLAPGSLVFVSGHVMMYLGKYNNDYYIIHNFSSGGGVNITTCRLMRTSTNTYLTSFYKFIEMK